MTVSAYNPWGISFMAMMHMSNDSHLFADIPGPGLLPLYEAKMIHQFDHRWATYDGEDSREVTDSEKADPDYCVTPRYWVHAAEVNERLNSKGWDRGWLMGWRDITNATNERTVIASVVPRVGVGHTMPLFMTTKEPQQVAALLGNFGALVLDFVARAKVGGTHLTYGYLKQLPNLPPDHYTAADLAFIVPRVLELTYTAHDLKPWAQDLGYEGVPFAFNPERRAQLWAELDAYYARLYGLNRDELRSTAPCSKRASRSNIRSPPDGAPTSTWRAARSPSTARLWAAGTARCWTTSTTFTSKDWGMPRCCCSICPDSPFHRHPCWARCVRRLQSH